MNNVKIDQELVTKKAREIGAIIDNVTLPNVLSILGTVIIEIFVNTKGQGVDIRDLMCGWLSSMVKGIRKMYMDNDHDHDENFAN